MFAILTLEWAMFLTSDSPTTQKEYKDMFT